MPKTERKNLTFEWVGATLPPVEMNFRGSDGRRYKAVMYSCSASSPYDYRRDGWEFVRYDFNVIEIPDGDGPPSKHPGPTFMELWVKERT